MSNSALSAAATTGLFTLLGTVIGAVLAGLLALFLEVLRRRWQKKDTEDKDIKERRDAELKERKDLYPQLLAKGMELDYLALSTYITERPKPPTRSGEESTIEDVLNAFSKILPKLGTLIPEFENLRARAEMLAGTTVQRLIKDWDNFLTDKLAKLGVGQMPSDEGDPYGSLIQAMRLELVSSSDSASQPLLQNDPDSIKREGGTMNAEPGQVRIDGNHGRESEQHTT